MHKKFDHQAIEKKWQEKWQSDKLYDAGNRDDFKKKEYVLVELPYPSGNLHIGHWYAFAVPDIYIRFLNMTGTQAIYPMGFDAFGLPAENAAIKRDINPREWTESNIDYMKTQLASMGASFSWDMTASTIDPDYYRWTQWMFIKFFENNIAYRGEAMVNWDPVDNTVIANEQVLPDGRSERSGALVEKKVMAQWMMRITDYADRLVDDLDSLDWPENIKEAQRRWIGRSVGANVHWAVCDESGKESGLTLTTFTTRRDTIPGVTFIVVAPESELTEQIVTAECREKVSAYQRQVATMSDIERQSDKTKSGSFTGAYAKNPFNGEVVPIYVASYVMSSYGTGVVMGMGGHDERDREFALEHNIPMVFTTEPPAGYEDIESQMIWSGEGVQVNTGAGYDGLPNHEAGEKIFNELQTKGLAEAETQYRLRDWSVGRQRYWGVPIPIVYDPDGKAHVVPEEHLPWTLPEDVDFRPTGEAPLAKSKELKERTEKIFGAGWTPEVETMDTFVDSSWYFLRYIDNNCQTAPASLEAQKAWMPIDIYFGGAEHTTMHLLYSRFWQKVLFDLKLATVDEPYQRRINRGLILGPDGNKMSKSKGNVIDPDDHVKTVGADSVKMYLAFMGPYGEGANYPFDLGGIAGIRRFLERVYGLREHLTDSEPESVTKQLHKTIQKVRNDVPEYKFNTAISAMMVFTNLVEKESLTKESYETFLKLLAPFAAHLCEELWHESGYTSSIHLETLPEADASLTVDDEITIGVQVNGKMRGEVTLSPKATEEEAVAAARAAPSLGSKLTGEVSKVIYVPGRILNFIIKN